MQSDCDCDFWRCNFTKVGSEIRVFQDLLTQLKRTRDFTGRKESTSATRSSERTAGDGGIVISVMKAARWLVVRDGGDRNKRFRVSFFVALD